MLPVSVPVGACTSVGKVRLRDYRARACACVRVRACACVRARACVRVRARCAFTHTHARAHTHTHREVLEVIESCARKRAVGHIGARHPRVLQQLLARQPLHWVHVDQALQRRGGEGCEGAG